MSFIWKIIFERFYPSTNDGIKNSIPSIAFQDFFRQVVDGKIVTLHFLYLLMYFQEVFFANNASTDRKYRGFQIFQQALAKVPEESAAALFTPNLLRCWINNLSVNDRYLHRMTLQLVSCNCIPAARPFNIFQGKGYTKASRGET